MRCNNFLFKKCFLWIFVEGVRIVIKKGDAIYEFGVEIIVVIKDNKSLDVRYEMYDIK